MKLESLENPELIALVVSLVDYGLHEKDERLVVPSLGLLESLVEASKELLRRKKEHNEIVFKNTTNT